MPQKEFDEKNTAPTKKYEDIPRYCGRVFGLAGGYMGAGMASLVTELGNQVGFRSHRSPGRAGMVGFLVAGSMSYAVGFFAGKVANYSHIPEGIEKVIQQVKKL